MTLLEEFKEFATKFELIKEMISEPETSLKNFEWEDVSMRYENWWYDPHVPFTDFNKEIVHPGENESYPYGAIGIRCDEDFWNVGVFPYYYKDLTIQEIVSIVWPNVKNPTFNPDVESKFK